ncbi:proline--tRNA ligase [Platysternon megacephalum]|uniref:Proline--tRNA ligase n=1 Tax=Platysternon megacephalum TaxID=55544 RepID=A0A4D9DEF4_9SAUR|nr:proline--tRNA ligase [Platysternon megacephalum]
MAPGDLGAWRFHFYKDGTEIVPRDEGSEISTMESISGSINISVLSIPQAGPNNTGEFTCGYEKNMSGRWIPSPRSQAVNVTWNVTRNYSWRVGWALPLPLVAGCGGGGAALGLLALLGCCYRRKKKGSSKTATGYLGVSGAPGVNLALQQRSHDGWDQPVTHNQRRLPSIPGGKSKKRGQGEEDAGTRAGCKSLAESATNGTGHQSCTKANPRWQFPDELKVTLIISVNRNANDALTGTQLPPQSDQLSMALTHLLPLLADPLPQPVLSVDPPTTVVSEGLPLLITCAAPRNSGEQRFHFYKDEIEIIPGDAGSEISTTEPGTGSLNISVLSIPQAGPNNTGEFTCGYEENMSGRWIPSPRSWAENITVHVTRTDTLPQPVLSMYPLSGAVSEGLPLLITCMAPRDAGERIFHFHNDGAKIFPEDVGSDVNTTESSTCSMNISVLSILWSGSNNTGEFTCEYEENVSGRWILSPRSLAMNVTVSARSFLCIQELVVGGSFFLINGLIFLVSRCCF